MFKLETKKVVNKPIEEVWDLASNHFVDVSKWATGVYSSRKGTNEEKCDRVCETSFGHIKEKFINHDNKNYSFQFKVEGFPFFVKSLVSTWKLKKLSKNQTEVSVTPKMQTMFLIGIIPEFMMRPKFEKLLSVLLNDFAVFAETGKVSKSKQKELDSRK